MTHSKQELEHELETLQQKLETMQQTNTTEKEGSKLEIVQLKQQIKHLSLKRRSPHTVPVPITNNSDELRLLKEELEKKTQQNKVTVQELSEKLQNRDTTISALVKSSVTMEQQIASVQIEMELLRAKLVKARSTQMQND